MNLTPTLLKSPWLVILPVLMTLSWDGSSYAQEPPPDIEQELQTLEDTILSGDYANGFVLSGSSLFTHRETPIFRDVVDTVYYAYAGRPETELSALLEIRKQSASPDDPGLAWIDTGLLAKALMKTDDEVAAFREALKDEQCCKIPFTYTLLGEALLNADDVQEATAAFNQAVHTASQETTTLFQVRRLAAKAFQKRGFLNQWRDVAVEASSSSFPLERAWAQKLLAEDAWLRGDLADFEQKWSSAVASASPYNASTQFSCKWEDTRYKQVASHLSYMTQALAGEDEGKIFLDHETAVTQAEAGDVEGAIVRLEPWIINYPMPDIDSWTPIFQLWRQRVQKAYHMLLARVGRYDEALAGMEELLAHHRVTPKLNFEPHIHCGIGYVLSLANRLYESRESYETCLSLLDVPGEVVDPNVGYHPDGLIWDKERMDSVANYRNVLSRISAEEAFQ